VFHITASNGYSM